MQALEEAHTIWRVSSYAVGAIWNSEHHWDAIFIFSLFVDVVELFFGPHELVFIEFLLFTTLILKFTIIES